MHNLALILILLAAATNAASIDPKVLADLQDSNEVSVIVMLENSANLTDVPDTIDKDHEFGALNGFSGTVSRESLGELLGDVSVASIQLNKPVGILLAQSAPLVNATQAWTLTLNGTNITGRGETVCIIDTGIDYNHSSLGGGWGSRVLSGYNYCANEACSQESSDPYDNHGHGTHVAGIIASNDSTNRGIAFEASLIAIKALNSAGSGTDDDVIAGINWCVANATAYNISVISMSIGSFNASNTGYCDSSEPAYSSAINTAVTNNISVIIASGNDASNTSMDVPGCIENATTVGAVYDANVGAYGSDSTTFADKITYYTNRNSKLDLLAPGSHITSANDGGGFVTLDGTSMATPHIAGAFALLRQYKRLENGTLLNPPQIENALKNRGLNVTDSRTGLNFSRINIYRSIVSIDASKPLLSVASPLNITYNGTNISLSYSASDNIALDVCSFTNTTGSAETLSGCANITFIAAANLQNNVTLIINDTNSNSNSSQIFFTVDTVPPLLSVSQPQNTTYNITNISIQYSASDSNHVDRCWLVNVTGDSVFLNNPREVCDNATFLLSNKLLNNITVYVNDTGGNTNSSTIFFSLAVSIHEPTNKTYSATNVSLNYTASGDTCWFVNTTGHTVMLLGCSNTTFTALDNRQNNITLFVNDSEGSTRSSQVFFTTDTISPFMNFTASAANNETMSITNDIIINITSSEALSAALLEWNGANLTMNISGSSISYSHADLTDGNYTFRIVANDSAGNINVTAFRWVYINATRNFTSYINDLNSSLSANNVTFTLLNTSGSDDASRVFVDINYTMRFNASGIVAEIANFSWLNSNTSNTVNVTRNITLNNVSAAFNSSGGLLDNYVWVDVNNFTNNYPPRVTFPGVFRLSYYLNGSRNDPETRLINKTCNGSNVPCFSISGNTTVISLASFSGAAVGNDTQPPFLSISSPAGTYSGSNISLSYSASDNVGLDKCWFSLNGGANVTPANCTNTTFIAASGSNALTLYANDTSGNSNSTSVSFTYSAPAASSGSSGGGGGGGSSSTASSSQFKKSWDVITSSVSANVSTGSLPIRFITLSVNSTARSASITISPEKTGPVPLENAYQYFSINTTNLNSVLRSEITFAVNKSWIEFNGYNKSKVALKRFDNGWMALPTQLTSENLTHLVYISTTTGFSYFAISGERDPLPVPVPNKTEEPERPACIQMIQPAIKDGVCINYPTPCDVPEGWTRVSECLPPAEEKEIERNISISMLTMILATILIIIFAIASYRLFFKKKMRRHHR